MRTTGFIAAGALAACLWPLAARAEAVAIVSFHEMRVNAFNGRMGGPLREVAVTLKGGNRIEDRDTRTPGGQGGWRRRGWGRGPNVTTNEGVFQGEFRPVAGYGAVGTWRVGRNNTLIRTTRHRNYTETITISLMGATACRADIVYRRTGGPPFFVNAMGRWAEIFAEGATCAISDAGQ